MRTEKIISYNIKEMKLVTQTEYRKGFISALEWVLNGAKGDDAYTLLAEVRADVDLAIKLSKYVHDNCKDVPHDIGLKLAEIVSEHFI